MILIPGEWGGRVARPKKRAERRLAFGQTKSPLTPIPGSGFMFFDWVPVLGQAIQTALDQNWATVSRLYHIPASSFQNFQQKIRRLAFLWFSQDWNKCGRCISHDAIYFNK
jgi:hypothetical protein